MGGFLYLMLIERKRMQVGDKRAEEEGCQTALQLCYRGTERKREETGGNCRMESNEQQCVGTTGSISVKQAFQKALMAEGKMKQKSKQVHVRCFAL